MTNLCVVAGCSTPHPESMLLCSRRDPEDPGHFEQLESYLNDVRELWKQLTVTMTRQDALGGDGGRKSAETALLFKLRASEVRWDLANTLGQWATTLGRSTGQTTVLTIGREVIALPPERPVDWLRRNTRLAAQHEEAGSFFDEVREAIRSAYAAIDSPPEMVLVGKCPTEGCGLVLYARPEVSQVECEACLEVHRVVERQEHMLIAAAVLPVTRTVGLSWVRLLMDKEIPYRTWQSWVARGKLRSVGWSEDVDGKTRPTYRFGDIRALALAWVTRRVA